MNEIRLILYAIILIVSIINIISFYSGKRRQKKLSGSLTESLKPIRSISLKEASALNKLNKRSMAAGMPVYRISGPYESNTLTVNNSQTEKVVTIGGVVVEFPEQLEGYLQDHNQAEIVDTDHKKGAVILNLNNQFSAVDEANIRKAMEEGTAYQKKQSSPSNEDQRSEAVPAAPSPDESSEPSSHISASDSFEFHQGRELSDLERSWLAPDYRTGAVIFTALFLFLAVMIPVLPVKAVLGTAGPALFLIFILPGKSPIIPKKFKKKTLVLSGRLIKGSDGWLMDRFSLDFPEQWEKNLKAGEKCSLEAYPMDPLGTRLKVIALNNIYSIQRELKREPFHRKDRWRLFSILGGIVLILNLVPLGNIPYKGVQIFNFFTTRDSRRDFKGYDEISSFPFRKGQKVSFSEYQALPALRGEEYGYYMIPPGSFKAPEFAAVKEALIMIEELQQTDEMLQLTALELRNEMDPSEFLYEYYPEEEPASMAEFASYYGDNMDFNILSEIFEALSLFPQDKSIGLDAEIIFPEGGNLKEHFEYMYSREYWTVETLLDDIGSIKGNLLWDEGIRINGLLLEEYREYLASLDALWISIYAPPEYISFVNSDELARFKRSNTWRNNQRLPMEFHDPIKAFKVLSELEETIETASRSSRKAEGIITAVEMEGSRITALTLDEYLDYDDIPLYLGDLFLFLVLLILTGYALASLPGIIQLSRGNKLQP